jgi:hypothetical protein
MTSKLAYLNPAPPTTPQTPGLPYPSPQEVTGHLARSGEWSTPFPPQNSGAFPSGTLPPQNSGMPASGPLPSNSGGMFASGALSPQNSEALSSPFASPPPPQVFLDEVLREREIATLESAGFLTAGKGSIGPASYQNGQPLSEGKVWTLQVYKKCDAGMLSMVFCCPMTYPASPPKVQVKPPTGGGWSWLEPNTIYNWRADRSLAEVAQEISESMF